MKLTALLQLLPKGPNTVLRVLGFAAVVTVCLLVLLGKLWHEQVIKHKKWVARLPNAGELSVRIPAIRGEIRDRSGITLVTNRPCYNVDLYLSELVRGYKELHGNVPKVQYEGRVEGMRKLLQEEDIVQVVNEALIPNLRQLDIAYSYNAANLQRHFRTNREVPFTYAEEIDPVKIALFSENDLGLPGVEVVDKPVRRYVYGALGAHLLGYVGMPRNIEALPDSQDFDFYQPSVEGKSNVEFYLDRYIAGRPGKRVLERKVKGGIGGEIRWEPPTPGNNVLLTVDARIQMIAERAMRAVGRGAAVVVDPNNGDILASVSIPSFDPNLFIPSISSKDWEALDEDLTDPLVNRAIQSFAPGSTYKTVSALAGLYAGMQATKTYHCSGSVTYGNKPMRCWIAEKGGAHGSLGLADALKQSCNCYFYQWLNDAKIENLDIVGDLLGLGKQTKVPLTGESSGILPGPEWLARVAPQEKWSKGYTANAAIGQGSVEASPLQMAMVTATLANGGISYYPRLVSRVVDHAGNDVLDNEGKPVAPPIGKVRADLRGKFSSAQVEVVRRGMWKVVNEGGGTGARARVKGVEVAGKTGTAQFWRIGGKDGREKVKDNHVWFICFAPYKEPKYAVCVMVQGAKSGGGVAAPIAQRILEQSLALEAGYDPQVAWLDPAPGSFDHINQVELKREGDTDKLVASLKLDAKRPGSAADDDETADHTEGPRRRRVDRANTQRSARPDVRESADDRGRIPAAKPVEVTKQGFFARLFGGKKDAATSGATNTAPPRPAHAANAGRGR
jgi:penicillin-binding protein 2